MRVVVIGGTGHIGTFLIPRLVNGGHEVIVASRGKRDPYVPHAAWKAVERIEIDRLAEDASRTFGPRIAALEADAVVDLLCFTPESAQQLVDALQPRLTLLLHCGTMWVHGRPTTVPVTEDAPRHPFGDYGIKKAAIEKLLHDATRRGAARAVVLHPGAATTELEIRECVAARLAPFKVPAQVLILPELPKGPTGKVARIGMASAERKPSS